MPHETSPLAAPPRAVGIGGGLPLTARRWIFFSLVAASVIGAATLMGRTLAVGGLSAVDWLIIALFSVTLPWNVIGFWNSAIGFLLMRGSRDPATQVCPALAPTDDRSAITAHTAVLSCIRNEDAETVGRNLDLMIDGLVQAGVADRFHVYVLSDSHWPEVIAAEEQRIAALAERWQGRMAVTYRRRDDNPGYKAGNIADFCARWGEQHDFMLVLDADSLMGVESVLRMVRTLQQHPEIGILQSLMAGLPTTSAFARPLQFGMRLLMHSFTMGNAWWQADVGPYWGHNALIRVAPFMAHCELPPLPGKGPLAGWVLSHDQVEAALMRRAGYEVRVIAEDAGSWEETPTTLTEYLRRDLRWCQGNLQYLKLLGLPGLHPISRWNLVLAMLGFIGSVAWIGMMLLFAGALAYADGPMFAPDYGLALFLLVMGMAFAPKLATWADLMLSDRGRRRFGGGPRLTLSLLGDMAMSVLITPILALAHTLFIGGLLFGRAAVWGAQRRAVHWVTPREALRRLWPQTLVGLAALGWFAWYGASGALLLSPFYVSLLLAVPIAVIGSAPLLGLAAARIGLWRTPDEVQPDPMVQALHLPALRRPTPRPLLGEAAADSAE